MKLSPKKNGKGYLSSYSINIGVTEARDCGFIDENGVSYEIEKIINPNDKTILIKLK